MDNKKIHVLVIPSWYPSGEDKLMGGYHKEFTRVLNQRDDVYANMLYVQRERLKDPFKYIKMKKTEYIDEINYTTLKLHMLNLRTLSEKLQQFLYNRKMLKAYKIYEKKFGKPDVIHAHVIVPAGYGATKIATKFNIPIIVTEHSLFNKRYFKGMYKKYSDYVLDNAIYSVVSKDLEKRLYPEVKNPERLPNLVDIEAFSKNIPKKKDDTLEILQVCALRVGKRIDFSVDAVKLILEKYPSKNVHLTVIGDGFYENIYKEHCTKVNMDKYVTFVGRKTKEEIVEYLKNTDVGIISSDYETFAIFGIEALASGVPVVSTACGGPEEYIDEKCGAICKVDDVSDFAEKIISVYENKENYDISYLRSVANRYSDKVVSNKAVELYKMAISNKNK